MFLPGRFCLPRHKPRTAFWRSLQRLAESKRSDMRGPLALPHVNAASFGRALLDPQMATPDGLTGPDGETAPKRFNVYRNNVIVSLCEALGESFPAVKALLGEEYFRALAQAFVTAHPPVSPVLIWYGAGFADFLDAFPPLKAYPYLGDVARLEWSWLQAYHAADAAPLDPAILGSVDPQRPGAFASYRIRRRTS